MSHAISFREYWSVGLQSNLNLVLVSFLFSLCCFLFWQDRTGSYRILYTRFGGNKSIVDPTIEPVGFHDISSERVDSLHNEICAASGAKVATFHLVFYGIASQVF